MPIPSRRSFVKPENNATDIIELDEVILIINPMKALSMQHSPTKAVNDLYKDTGADAIEPPRPTNDAPMHFWDLDDPEYAA